jgi:tetratricopeptide (TPR) repeat protein
MEKRKLWTNLIYVVLFWSLPLQAQETWQTLSDRGVEAFYAGKYQLAAEQFKQAISQAEREFGKTHPYYVISCTDLADAYRSLGFYEQAEPLYLGSRKTIDATDGEAHPYYITNRVGLAELYQLQGKYNLSEPLYIEAKNAQQKASGKDHPDYAVACNNLAILYTEQGLYAKAEPLYVEAKNIREKALGKTHPDYAIACNNLASIYLYQGLYEKAELLFLEAKAIDEKNAEKDPLSYATDCNNLAFLYQKQAKYDPAERLYLEAKAIREKNLGKAHPLYAISCNNLANLYLKQEKYQLAELLFLEAKNIREKTLGKEHLEFANACNNLANLYNVQAKYAQAYTDYQAASRVFIKQTESNFSHLSEKEKGLFFRTFNRMFGLYNSFALKTQAQLPALNGWLYDNALAIKGLLYQSSEKIRQNILNSGNPALVEKYQTWKQDKDYLAKVYQMPSTEKQKQGIDEKKLEEEVNNLEKELSRQSNLFAQDTQHLHYTWQAVQKKLQKNEAAVELIRTQYFAKDWTDSVLYIALIIKPETKNQPEMVVLPNGKMMEGKFLQYYLDFVKHGTSRGTRGDEDTLVLDSDDLDIESIKTETNRQDFSAYEVFWQAIAQKIKGKKNVFLSIDGVYNSLNINTLQNPKTQKFVLDEVNIQLVGSTKDLLTKNLHQTSLKLPQNAVLLGFPDYNHRSTVINRPSETIDEIKTNNTQVAKSRFFNGKNIDELPGTKVEVEKVEGILKSQSIDYQTFMYEKASENEIKKVNSPQVLHIATHGFFLNDLPKIEEKTNLFSGIETQKFIENPLLRSGLLFAGCKDNLNFQTNKQNQLISTDLNLEDGVLTAYEAMNLNLDKTDLVVLSACETGLGQVQNGEGVYGLQRAFQQAGAKSVLMSLWTVSDESTQRLMTYFYENWLTKRQSKRQAFKNAQLQLREKYPEPYHWGAFVMVGE